MSENIKILFFAPWFHTHPLTGKKEMGIDAFFYDGSSNEIVIKLLNQNNNLARTYLINLAKYNNGPFSLEYKAYIKNLYDIYYNK